MQKLLCQRLNKLFSMPVSKAISVIVRYFYKNIKNTFIRHMDLIIDTHSNKIKNIAYSYINIHDIDISNINTKAAQYLSDMYLTHCFDLLGSGYVKVTYDMNCHGVEGNVYDGSKHIYYFDIEGNWLKKILRRGNLKFAKNIWRCIDRKYSPIDWQMDFKSGFRYSQKKWYLDQPIGKRRGVDIKVPWELGRLQHLPQLAVFAMIFTEKREVILKEFRNQVLDFIMANPPKMGALWTCTMDVGIRTANMLIAFDIFKQLDEYNILDDSFNKIFNLSMYEHAHFIIHNLEWHESFAGNHYLADICGLLFAVAYLNRDDETDSWLAFTVQEIIAQALKQFYEDGSNFEASTSYHRLSGEFIVYSTALLYGVLKVNKRNALIECKNNSINRLCTLSKQKYDVFSEDFFPMEYIERIYKAAFFTADITKDNGNISQIGDNDSGRFFKLSPNGELIKYSDAVKKYINLGESSLKSKEYFDENIINHDTFISAANGFFEDEKLTLGDKFNLEKSIIKSLSKNKSLSVKPFEYRINISDEQVSSLKYCIKKEIRFSDYMCEVIDINRIQLKCYPYFGIYIFRCSNFYLSVMAGGVGQNGIGGHSHNDKLSFELNLNGRDIYIDPGTYLYTALPEERDKFRSAKAHNIPIVNDEEQCSFTGAFSVKNEIKCGILKCTRNNLVVYLTYRNIKILREFIINTDKLIIIDKCNKAFFENYNKFNLFSNAYGRLIKVI